MSANRSIWKSRHSPLRATITAYLWSNPDLSHLLRLALFWYYLPLLLWRFVAGRLVVLAEYDEQ